MSELTPEERIAQLVAENKLLQMQVNSPTSLHPDVQPKYFNGSIVLYHDQPYRINSRSIDLDSNVTYNLQPVDGRVVHVTTDKDIFTYALSHESARDNTHAGILTYNVTTVEGDGPVFEVPEEELEPFRQADVSLGMKVTTASSSDQLFSADVTKIERS